MRNNIKGVLIVKTATESSWPQSVAESQYKCISSSMQFFAKNTCRCGRLQSGSEELIVDLKLVQYWIASICQNPTYTDAEIKQVGDIQMEQIYFLTSDQNLAIVQIQRQYRFRAMTDLDDTDYLQIQSIILIKEGVTIGDDGSFGSGISIGWDMLKR